jgi:hypothetical protein
MWQDAILGFRGGAISSRNIGGAAAWPLAARAQERKL